MILKYRVDFRQMKKKLISENKLEFDKIVKAKNLYIMMKKIKKMKFISKSLQNSQMNWDNVGTGEVVVSVDNNKIYFFEEIHLENGMKLNDKKMWEKVAEITAKQGNKVTAAAMDSYYFDGENFVFLQRNVEKQRMEQISVPKKELAKFFAENKIEKQN